MRAVLQPHEVLLVVDATTGQEAVNVAQAFHERLELTGIIMSKMDGDARGGAALSVKAVVGKPVRFVGVGERTDALEPFYPDRIASRILGMGDVLSLIERVEQTMQEEEAKRLEKKMRDASFDFEDMLAQIRQIRKMGPFEQLIQMLPGFSQIKRQVGDMPIDDRALKRAEAIILSMTPQERRHPEIINYSRKVRIAKGSGVKLEEVSALVNQLFEMRKLMKQMTKLQQRMQKRKWSPFGKRR
jgi:signal recognition particle subunit SRP54